MPKLGASFPTNAKSRRKHYEETGGGKKYKGGTALDRINDSLDPTDEGKAQWFHPTKGKREMSVKSLRASHLVAEIKKGRTITMYMMQRFLLKGI